MSVLEMMAKVRGVVESARNAVFLLKWCTYVIEGALNGHVKAMAEIESTTNATGKGVKP